MRPTRRTSKRSDGFRSRLEAQIAQQIKQITGKPAVYEELTVEYTKPARVHKYTPDFQLPNGIIIESKGIFEAADREKHLLVKEQHPDLDIRFVFYRAAQGIYPRSKTTLAQWADKHGFRWAEKLIPIAWFKERP